jgi:phage recombination protein Bet
VTAITKTEPQSMFSREDIAVVKATCAPEATDAELKMFLHIAQRSGLDPLRKQIHFMKYQGRVSIVADINGLQARAAREPDFDGITHACVYEKEEFLVDNVTGEVVKHISNPFSAQRGKLVGAWATVHRRGMKPFTSIVHMEEYTSSYNPLWKTKPSVMLDKCAKSTALRLAYPEQLGGIYERAELEKAKPETDITPQAALPLPQDAIARKATAIVEQVEDALAAQAPSIPILDHDPDT